MSEKINAKQFLHFPDLKTKSENTIGEGGFSKVYKGEYKSLKLAIKQVKGKCTDTTKLINKELNTMRKFRHPNVPIFYGISANKGKSTQILLELIKGQTMKEYITTYLPKNIDLVLLFLDFASVLELFHNCGYIHRDIKPSNLMITHTNQLKMIDFGISRFSEHTSTSTQTMGTVRYMAPENFDIDESQDDCDKPKIKISNKVDSWGFGLTLIEAFSGRLPWSEIKDHNNSNLLIALMMKRTEVKIPSEIKNHLIVDLINNCVKYNSKERYTSKDIKGALMNILFEATKKQIQKKTFKTFNSKHKVSSQEFRRLLKIENYLTQLKRKLLLQTRRRSHNQLSLKIFQAGIGSDDSYHLLTNKINQLIVQIENSPANPQRKRKSLNEIPNKFTITTKRLDSDSNSYFSKSPDESREEISPRKSEGYKLENNEEYLNLINNLNKCDIKLEESMRNKERKKSFDEKCPEQIKKEPTNTNVSAAKLPSFQQKATRYEDQYKFYFRPLTVLQDRNKNLRKNDSKAISLKPTGQDKQSLKEKVEQANLKDERSKRTSTISTKPSQNVNTRGMSSEAPVNKQELIISRLANHHPKYSLSSLKKF